MALGSGEGQGALWRETNSNLVVRPGRVLNRFDYIEARVDAPEPIAVYPGGMPPLTVLQPPVPATRAEKEQAKCAADYIRTIADHNSPPPPLPPKVSWPQSRATSPYVLTTAVSRTEQLSQKMGGRRG